MAQAQAQVGICISLMQVPIYVPLIRLLNSLLHFLEICKTIGKTEADGWRNTYSQNGATNST
jgi:hypothetical protein